MIFHITKLFRKLFPVVILFCFVGSVRILNLRLPKTYVISNQDNWKRLILDCEFEFHPLDIGFVLKWYHQNKLFYQWIANRTPYVFGNFKNHVNMSYFVTEDERYKYRAIELVKPMSNFSGDYMCSVQTYKTRDRKIGRIQMIVPEDEFLMEQHGFDKFAENFEYMFVQCNVLNIYPEPDLKLSAGNVLESHIDMLIQREQNSRGFFNKSLIAKINKYFMESPSTLTCILSIKGANYTKKKEQIYYDHKFIKHAINEKLSVYSRFLNSIENHSAELFHTKWKPIIIIILIIFTNLQLI